MEEYVAKKSVWGVISFWKIISCILIIPLFILIFNIIATTKEKIVFYSDKVIYEKGLFNIKKKTFAFTGVFAVDVEQSLWGRIFKYGDLRIDFVGKTDIDTNYIKTPKKLMEYLETKMVQKSQVYTHMY